MRRFQSLNMTMMQATVSDAYQSKHLCINPSVLQAKINMEMDRSAILIKYQSFQFQKYTIQHRVRLVNNGIQIHTIDGISAVHIVNSVANRTIR